MSNQIVDSTLTTLRRLVDQTRDFDYDPSQEAWVCGEHGMPECRQGECPNLPWPQPYAEPLLSAFMAWADSQFLDVVRPYDLSEDPNKEMPDEAFRSYTLREWPVGALLGALEISTPTD